MKGKRKWKTRIARPIAPQPPRKRARYQWISSGMLPDQTIRFHVTPRNLTR